MFSLFKYITKFYVINTYKKKNKFLFKKYIDKKNYKKKVIVEFNAFQSTHIPISILSNYLRDKFKLEICAFYNYSIISSNLKFNIFQELKWFVGNFLNLGFFGIYKSFGVKEIFKPSIIENNYTNLYSKKLKKLTKKKLLNFSINGIVIGDLLYDTYLKKYQKSTVNIYDEKFQKMFFDFINLYNFWNIYLKKNEIHSIIACHSVYSYGLISRIAIKRKINVFLATSTKLFRLNNKYPVNFSNFEEYKNEFKKLSNKEKKINLKKARLKIIKRLKGVSGAEVDLLTNNSAFKKNKYYKYTNYFDNNKKPKIIIFTRNLFDATHVFKDQIFLDNKDWLENLGKLSKKTNYDWYLKVHHNLGGKFSKYQSISDREIYNIVKKYKFKILPADMPHNYIINKIDLALTQHGSIGFEYAWFNKKVINASPYNPRMAYKYNINPKNKKEYLDSICNFKKLKVKFDKNEICENYYMQYMYFDKNWIFDDYSKMIKQVGSWDNQFSTKIYEYFNKNFNEYKIRNIYKRINNFYNSKKHQVSVKH